MMSRQKGGARKHRDRQWKLRFVGGDRAPVSPDPVNMPDGGSTRDVLDPDERRDRG